MHICSMSLVHIFNPCVDATISWGAMHTRSLVGVCNPHFWLVTPPSPHNTPVGTH